jgi:hypothetical protein
MSIKNSHDPPHSLASFCGSFQLLIQVQTEQKVVSPKQHPKLTIPIQPKSYIWSEMYSLFTTQTLTNNIKIITTHCKVMSFDKVTCIHKYTSHVCGLIHLHVKLFSENGCPWPQHAEVCMWINIIFTKLSVKLMMVVLIMTYTSYSLQWSYYSASNDQHVTFLRSWM